MMKWSSTLFVVSYLITAPLIVGGFGRIVAAAYRGDAVFYVCAALITVALAWIVGKIEDRLARRGGDA
jgi:hypothetical protein